MYFETTKKWIKLRIFYEDYETKAYENEYFINYKGYRANPTLNNNRKVHMFSILEVTDIDTSIPFEIIFFL